MNLNIEDIKSQFQKHEIMTEQIMERLSYIWICAKKDFGLNEYEGRPDSFGFSEDFETINVEWYDSWPYGGWDRGNIKLPTKLLWSNIIPYFEEIKKLRDENLKKSAEKEKKEIEKSEKQLLKTLKEKYEK